ncbi:unnamed protein product, partial [Musa banksii]
ALPQSTLLDVPIFSEEEIIIIFFVISLHSQQHWKSSWVYEGEDLVFTGPPRKAKVAPVFGLYAHPPFDAPLSLSLSLSLSLVFHGHITISVYKRNKSGLRRGLDAFSPVSPDDIKLTRPPGFIITLPGPPPCMGQSASSRLTDSPPAVVAGISTATDYTADLPDDCLALVFQSLGPGDRKRCSLVCRRWLAVEGRSRLRLALDARAALLDLRACGALTDAGMAAVARYCSGLRKLSVGSCAFGAKGVDAVLRGCPLLEELSIKRLRGLHDPSATAELVAGAASLRSVCLKGLYNAQCFAPLIAGCPNLKTLKLIRCSGDWDPLLKNMAARVPGVVEIHLERLQVTDSGLAALSVCVDLEVLRLVKTPECTNAGLAAVADRCAHLRKVHIDGWRANRIGDEGLQALARRCAGLQELVLIGVNPTSRTLELMASNCRRLERLAFCGSDTFGDAEVACIASKCAALKKLCIKGCPISDQGMEALAAGCPKLVKVKVKRCSGVTPECADRLAASRNGKLAVNVEADEGSAAVQQAEGTVVFGEFGIAEDTGGAERPPLASVDRASAAGPLSSKSRRTARKKRAGFFASRRNLVASALRRWSHGSSYSRHSHRQLVLSNRNESRVSEETALETVRQINTLTMYASFIIKCWNPEISLNFFSFVELIGRQRESSFPWCQHDTHNRCACERNTPLGMQGGGGPLL